MSITFSPMNNQETIPITTDNSNILVTLTSPSNITTTATSSRTVSINPVPAVSVAATGQDAKF